MGLVQQGQKSGLGILKDALHSVFGSEAQALLLICVWRLRRLREGYYSLLRYMLRVRLVCFPVT